MPKLSSSIFQTFVSIQNRFSDVGILERLRLKGLLYLVSTNVDKKKEKRFKLAVRQEDVSPAALQT
jgi:hypothetical protein